MADFFTLAHKHQVLTKSTTYIKSFILFFSFETSNGISHQESGAPKNVGPEGPSVVSQGATSYTAPNGEVVSIQFQADENGYVAQG